MRRTLRLFACAAGMLVVAVGVAALLKDEPGYEAGRSEVSGKIVGLTEYQEGRGGAEGASSSMEEEQASGPEAIKDAEPPSARMDDTPPSGEKSSFTEGSHETQSLPNAPRSGEQAAPASEGAVSSPVHEKAKTAASVVEASSVREPEQVEEKKVPAEREETPRSAEKASAEKAVLSQQAEKSQAAVVEAVAERKDSRVAASAAKNDAAEEAGTARTRTSAASSREASAEPRIVSGGEGVAGKKARPRYERVVTSAKFSMKGSLIKLVLQGNAPMVGHCSVLGNPDRVVLDLAGNWDLEVPRVPSNRLVQAVRVGQHDDKTRIVLDMKTMGKVALVPLNRNCLELSIQ